MARKAGKNSKNLWKDNIIDVPLSNGMSLRVIEGADCTLSIEAVADATYSLLKLGPGNTTTVSSTGILERLVSGFVFKPDSKDNPHKPSVRVEYSLPLFSRLSEVEYNLSELEDWELAALAVICYDTVSVELTGFTRVSGKLPWELTATRGLITWGVVEKLFDLFVGTSFDAVMSGLEDSEIEQIRSSYGDPVKNVKTS